MVAILFILFLALIILGTPIAVSLVSSSLTYLMGATTIPLTVVAQRMFTGADSFPLMAVPFFIVAGVLMESGGISKKLIRFADACLGHRTGGLAMVVIVTSAFFAAISGSSAATVTAIGMIMIPAMISKGYDRRFAAAVQCCSGQMGIIIPPSIAMVVFAVSTETSISDMFKAGFIPGIFMAICLCTLSYFVCKKRGYVGSEKSTWKQRAIAFKDAFLAILMPVLVLGTIYAGVCTPTESAAIAVIYAFVLGKFVYHELTWKKVIKQFADAAITTATILFLIACACVFAWVLGRLNVPSQVAAAITSIAHNKIVFLLLVNLLLFIVGMFMDVAPAITILAPLLCPVALGFGINIIHFGIIMVVNLAVGLCTPPVGINIFLSCQIAEIPFTAILKDILPFLLVLILVTLAITFVPWMSLALL
ncbi:TRAP transporter large permease [Agathobaculum sp. NTUH-O15-33]|uniref:TRAP transporter large permease n=1 Tax=Agathobaculum sp. NTUH-O15-33 TaxID=3079302 RepID=UPI0029584C25|nr:TRAP transporter large permease [Agathobaculum sp. NTUH-O15-33]WNX83047.1 TRAP transporter large permease [Agathobaculum sp. NTUH-O15-33]